MSNKMKVSGWDFEDLALKVCGLDTNQDAGYAEAEEALWDKYEISFESFEKLITDLLPYTVKSKSEITDTTRFGFVDHEEGVYILKAELLK
jgi:hypothetical protein